MAIDTKYSYWEIFYNSDIPLKERLLLAPLAGPAALLSLVGCVSEDSLEVGPQKSLEPKTKACISPHKVPKASDWPHEKIYSKGDHYVIADAKIREETAKQYLSQIPPTTQTILNFFGIDSPYKDNLRIHLLDLKHHANVCLPKAKACANAGAAYFPLYGLEEATINNDTFYHELSHALRHFVAEPWWGLEEGLAVYTERHLAETTKVPHVSGKSIVLYSESIRTGQPITFSQDKYKDLLDFTATITEEGEIAVTYTALYGGKDYPPSKTHLQISSGDYRIMYDYLMHVEIQDEHHVLLKLYNLPPELGGPNVGRSSLVDQKRVCEMDGIRTVWQIATVDGVAFVKANLPVPYEMLGSFKRNGIQGDYYETGFCFWEVLRQHHGHDAVKTMVQSMLEFSKQQQISMCPVLLPQFPFFNTFKEVTRMTDAQAKEYFDHFSAPTDDVWYKLGSVHWPKSQ